MEDIVNEVELTKGQDIALSNLSVWANDVTSNDIKKLFASLIGSAGTGKTFIINRFLMDHHNKRICVTAPTHKAKIVVQKMTGQPAQTIQALCGLRMNTELERFDINRPQFDPLGEPQMGKYNIVIIDETSMINKSLHKLLKDTAKETKTKLLFIGDKLQLPPVKETVSMVFSDTEILYKNELTEIIRQKDTNPLLIVLGTLRNDIKNLTVEYLDIFKETPVGIKNSQGYITLNDKKTILDTVATEFKAPEYNTDKSHIKYMAWTNKSVKEANTYIRELLMGKNLPNVKDGDVLMSYKNIINKKDNTYKLINSEDYLIINVNDMTNVNGFQIEGRAIIIKSITTDDTSVLFIVDPLGYEKYQLVHEDLLLEAKKNNRLWHKFFTFVENYILMEDLYDNERRLVAKKGIDYGYAITVHKSQGSTYKNVIINNRDINKNRSKTEAKKLLYVACSRPTDRAIILQ